MSTYASVVVLVLIHVGAVLLNLLVIVIIFQDPLLREKTDCIFIANLAFADFLVASTIIPFSIENLLHKEPRFSNETSFFIGFGNFLFCIASIMTLMLLVLDQTCAIKWPLRYERYRTKRLAVFMSLLSWLYSAACALPPAFGLASYSCFIANTGLCTDYDWAGTNGSVIFTIAVTSSSWGLALTVTVICYVQIFIIVIKQRKRLKRTKPVVQIDKTVSNYAVHERTKKRHSFSNFLSNGNMLGLHSTSFAGRNGQISTEPDRRASNTLYPGSRSIPKTRALFSFAAQLIAIQAQQEHLMELTVSANSNGVSKKKEQDGHSVLKSGLWSPAKTLLLIICVYFFTWSPFCILLLIEIALEKKLTSSISLVFLWIGHSSSMLNPILYFLRYRKFRTLAVKLVRGFRHRLDDVVGFR